METVLVLEDEPTNLKVIALVLRLEGFCVLEAADGHTAIQMCIEDRKRIHVLVADVQLPDLSGTQVAIELLKLWPDIGVLFTSGAPLSAWAAGDLASLSHLSGAAVDVLEKPFTPLILGKKVRQLLGIARGKPGQFS